MKAERTGEAELLAAARNARRHAHAPYSGYRVGAAVRAASGNVYAGCNVENASYGATICAERVAVAAMVAAGEKRLTAVAVVTAGKTPGMPCGICRQVLAEFGQRVVVVVATARRTSRTSLRALLPRPFVLSRP